MSEVISLVCILVIIPKSKFTITTIFTILAIICHISKLLVIERKKK